MAFGPVKLFSQPRAEDSENLAIDVIDCCGKEQERADDPTVAGYGPFGNDVGRLGRPMRFAW